eukprot:TRINITY_DN46163_c0_g1_i1.p1 TRINITY_DN46163_c0_g1~~TRINITY_DN46163_c0_g1_i1.p1  ORF type:complete len:349 (-),score=40.28 TRINITY_DN46163_c0_g1_i1:186-1232(-)
MQDEEQYGTFLPKVPPPRAGRAITGFSGYVPGQNESLGVTQGRMLKGAAEPRTIPVTQPKSVAGSFLAAAAMDGTVYDHRFETTSRAMNSDVDRLAEARGYAERPPGAKPVPRGAVGYTGHVHLQREWIGRPFCDALADGDAIVAAQKAATQPPTEFQKHWTDYYHERADTAATSASPPWRSAFALSLARRAPPSALAQQLSAKGPMGSVMPPRPTWDEVLVSGARTAGLERDVAASATGAAAIPSFRDSFKGDSTSDERPAHGAGSGTSSDWTMRRAPAAPPGEQEEDPGGPLSLVASKRIAGYGGHVPRAVDNLGKTHGRVQAAMAEAAMFGYGEPPHPLGQKFVR